ncbi:hypothetical protein VCRA2134O163_720001 [Vibrio crassostreae]|nr:hypothetical protein VCRA2134O163_720001 [Vibrio crassostreae]
MDTSIANSTHDFIMPLISKVVSGQLPFMQLECFAVAKVVRDIRFI